MYITVVCLSLLIIQFCVIIDDGICWNNAQLIIVENKKKIAANKDIDTDQGHNILYAHAYIT